MEKPPAQIGTDVADGFLPLTDAMVEAQTDAQSFARGRTYHRRGHILDPTLRGSTLRARCRGSSGGPYAVRATLPLAGETAPRGRVPVTGSCECPRGGFCKHVVALFLTWVHTPEVVQVRPEISALLAERSHEELVALIELMVERQPDFELLVDLPLPTSSGIAPAAPGTAAKRTVDETAIRRQVVKVLSQGAYDGYDYRWDEGNDPEVAAELHGLREIGDRYLDAGRWADAQAVYTAIADEILASDEVIYDDVAAVVINCGTGLLRTLEAQADQDPSDRLSSGDREELLRTVYEIWLIDHSSAASFEFAWRGPTGGILAVWRLNEEGSPPLSLPLSDIPGVILPEDLGAPDQAAFDVPTAITRHATAAEKTMVEGWLRELLGPPEAGAAPGSAQEKRAAIQFLATMRAEEDFGDEERLAAYREAELWTDATDLLLQLNRVDEAVALAGRKIAEPHALLAFADRLLALGGDRIPQALGLVDGRLWETEGKNPAQDTAYLTWLAHRYAEQGMAKEALATELRRFKVVPRLATYQAVQNAATMPGQPPELWPETRSKLLATLEATKALNLLLEIALQEGRIADAIAVLKRMEEGRERPSMGVWWNIPEYQARVAQAAEAEYPDEAIRLYTLLGERAIEGRNRTHYQVAAKHLAKVKLLQERQGRTEAWHSSISDLQERHKRLRALKEELDALDLR